MSRMILALALLLPAVASADKTVGAMEFMMGLGSGWEATPDEGEKTDGDLSVAWGIIPSFEKMLGKSVAVGGEWMFVWMKPDEGEFNNRLIMSPHVRARMSFPIVKKVTADAMLGIGPTFWTSDDSKAYEGNDLGGFRMGWSLRFGFGGSYRFNKSVSAFGQIGYYTTTSFGDDVELNYNTIPASVGLRSNF